MATGISRVIHKIGGILLRLVPPWMVVIILSGVNKGFRWVRGSTNCPEWLGIYETEFQHLLQTLVKPDMVAYDVGANAGFFTLALSRLVGAGGKVLAFEPQPGNAAKIVRHLQLNSVTNAVLVQAAVGRHAGLCAFDIGKDDYQGRITGAESVLQVPVIGLDELLATGTPVPDLIKMDIEGGEFEALNGALNLLRTHRPVLLLSVHGPEQDEKCRELLRRVGYRFEYFGSTTGPNKDMLVQPVA